jgi:Flp pilus assembly protein TadD
MILLALLLAAAPSPRNPAAPGTPELSVAERGGKPKRAALLLRMGRFVQAEEALASVAEPSPRQRFQRTQALLGMGHCTQGQAMLPSLKPAQQNAALYQELASCFAHHQQWHRSAEWLTQAEQLSSELEPGQSALFWLVLSRAGLDAAAASVEQRAAEQAPAYDQIQLMRATRAVDLGDVEAADAALWTLPAAAQDRPAVHLLNAQLELDLGNLAAAEAHAKAAMEGSQEDVRARALLAECRRRMGWSFGADRTLKRKPLLVAHHPQLRAVAIRISVDRGDLETAEQLLQTGLDAGFADAELYASAWYLHHHLQDGQAEIWAQRWSQVNESELRSLEQL